MSKELALSEARRQLSEVVSRVQYQGENYVILKNGEPVAAVVPVRLLTKWQAENKKLFDVIRDVNRRNEDVDPDQLFEDVLNAQQAIRAEVSK